MREDSSWLQIFYKSMNRQWGDDDQKDIDQAILETNKIYKAMKKAEKENK